MAILCKTKVPKHTDSLHRQNYITYSALSSAKLTPSASLITYGFSVMVSRVQGLVPDAGPTSKRWPPEAPSLLLTLHDIKPAMLTQAGASWAGAHN